MCQGQLVVEVCCALGLAAVSGYLMHLHSYRTSPWALAGDEEQHEARRRKRRAAAAAAATGRPTRTKALPLPSASPLEASLAGGVSPVSPSVAGGGSRPVVESSRVFQGEATSTCERGRDSLHAVGTVDVRCCTLAEALRVLEPMWSGETMAKLMRDVDRCTPTSAPGVTPGSCLLESTVSIGPIKVDNRLHFTCKPGPREMRYSLLEPSFPILTLEQRSWVEVVDCGDRGDSGGARTSPASPPVRGQQHLRITSDQRFGLYRGWGGWVPGFGRLLGAMCAYKMRRAVEDMASAVNSAAAQAQAATEAASPRSQHGDKNGGPRHSSAHSARAR